MRYRVQWYYEVIKSWIGLPETYFFFRSARKRIAKEVGVGDNYNGRRWNIRKWRIERIVDHKILFEVEWKYRNI